MERIEHHRSETILQKEKKDGDLKKKALFLESEYKLQNELLWAPDIAAEVAEELRDQLDQVETQQGKRALIMDRFIDAFYPKEGDDLQSDLAEQQGIEAVRLTEFECDLLDDKSRVGATSEIGEERREERGIGYKDIKVKAYGTDVFVQVVTAGSWVKVDGEKVDMVGSAKFTCCTAIAGINDAGDFCFAHIPGPDLHSLRYAGKGLIEQKFGKGNYVMVSPERKFKDTADQDDIKLGDDANQRFAEYAKELGIPHYSYIEMFPVEGSVLDGGGVSYTMVLTKTGLRVQLVKTNFAKGVGYSYHAMQSSESQEVVEDWPVVDIAFDK